MSRRKQDPSKIPNWMWALICVILAVAVVIGAVAFVLHMGYFEEGFDLNAIPTNLEESPFEELDEEQDSEETAEETEEIQEPAAKGCTGLAISQKEVVLDEIGERVFLTVSITPDDCEDEILYASSDEDVVTVSASGMLTAVASGEAEVLISCGTFSEVCLVHCVFETEQAEDEQTEETQEPEKETEEQESEPEAPPAPTVTPSDFTLFYPGESTYLSVKNVPEGAAVSYVSSHGGVVTVTPDGKVTAVGEGMATITITVGDVQITSIARCNFESTTEG